MSQRIAAGLLAALFLATVACRRDGSTASPTPTPSPTTPEPSSAATLALTPSPGPDLPGLSLDLASEPPVLTVLGSDSQDFAEGIPSLGHGDFNADRFDDILIGAPLADGPDNSRDGAGESYVIFGRSDLPARLNLAEGEQDVTIFGGAAGDALGSSVLGADVNGDGIDDILVGAPGTSGPEDPRTDQGQVYVFFGSKSLAGSLDIAKAAAPLTISGAEGFSRVGHAIASGDVNGDGANDIVLGAPFAGRVPDAPPGGQRTEVGQVYVVFGSSDLGGYISIPFDQQDFTITGKQRFGQFGAAVAAADVNADGLDDIIVGAPQSDGPDGAPKAAGAVYVFFGAHGLSGGLSIAEGAGNLAILGGGERHSLGFPLTTGDFNADGIADIAMGAQLAAGPGETTSRGAVYLTFGRSDLAGTLSLAAGEQDAAIFAAQPSQLLPSSLASGDINGDRAADLVIGSGPANGPGDRGGAGLAYVVLGHRDFTPIDLAQGGQDLTVVGIRAGDSLGSSVALAAVGEGGQPNLVLLASAADGPDGARPDSGAVYVVRPGP